MMADPAEWERIRECILSFVVDVDVQVYLNEEQQERPKLLLIEGKRQQHHDHECQ